MSERKSDETPDSITIPVPDENTDPEQSDIPESTRDLRTTNRPLEALTQAELSEIMGSNLSPKELANVTGKDLLKAIKTLPPDNKHYIGEGSTPEKEEEDTDADADNNDPDQPTKKDPKKFPKLEELDSDSDTQADTTPDNTDQSPIKAPTDTLKGVPRLEDLEDTDNSE